MLSSPITLGKKKIYKKKLPVVQKKKKSNIVTIRKLSTNTKCKYQCLKHRNKVYPVSETNRKIGSDLKDLNCGSELY